MHLSEDQFKQLLEEQVSQQFSEEFDDISHLLRNPDRDEPKLGVTWKLLEKLFSVETKKNKKKRKDSQLDAENPTKKHKKEVKGTRCVAQIVECEENDAHHNTDCCDEKFKESAERSCSANVKEVPLSESCGRDKNCNSQEREDDSVSAKHVGRQSGNDNLDSEESENELLSGSDGEGEESEDEEDEDEQSLRYGKSSGKTLYAFF